MDREFLADYETKENEAVKRFGRSFLRGDFDTNEGYPSRCRFPKMKDPLAWSASMCSIWPQIPLCGSLLIHLHPRINPDEFRILHGFDVADIERLVDFARDTGKVQFALAADAHHFEGMNFLDPIFKELKPPTIYTIPYYDIIGEELARKIGTEFETIAGIDFTSTFASQTREYVSGATLGYIEKRLMNYRMDYIVLKALGYEKITDAMDDALLMDYPEAIRLFHVYGNLIASPSVTPMRLMYNHTLEEIKSMGKTDTNVVDLQQIPLPFEIGKFLFQKLVPISESYQSCVEIVSHYQEEDLYRVFEALNTGVQSRDLDKISVKSSELSVILENIWCDAKRLFRTSQILSYGIPIDLAVIGSIVGLSAGVGPTMGFLAGLGYKVMEQVIKVGSDSITQKIAKIGEPNYISAIFDFQRKHQIR